jgi:hypothetical protein
VIGNYAKTLFLAKFTAFLDSPTGYMENAFIGQKQTESPFLGLSCF